MARVFHITTAGSSLDLDARGQGEVSFTVSNAAGGFLRRFTLKVGKLTARLDEKEADNTCSKIKSHEPHQPFLGIRIPDIITSQDPPPDTLAAPETTVRIVGFGS